MDLSENLTKAPGCLKKKKIHKCPHGFCRLESRRAILLGRQDTQVKALRLPQKTISNYPWHLGPGWNPWAVVLLTLHLVWTPAATGHAAGAAKMGLQYPC